VSTTALPVERSAAADYLELTKPRITLMVTLTAGVGYVMAAGRGGVEATPLAVATLGTALVASGASTLNMVMERRTDALMLRTRLRPIPSGRLSVAEATAWGCLLTAVGLGVLGTFAGWLPALVALVTWASYLFLYTPMKVRSSLSTVVGAFPGALPPVIGWTAATGSIDAGAYLLFAIMFVWQIPHFLAIAWLYREDYARGGMPMLPVIDPTGELTGRQAVANSVALLAVSFGPTLAGMTGTLYVVGAAVLGAAFLAAAWRVAQQRSVPAARVLFLVSVLYLPALFAFLVADRV
jgi:protoheme IX farnesyltransferase